MSSKHLSALVIASLVAIAPRAEANTSVHFNPGSLIIPSTSAFQTDCGAVSMYGLVYDVLRANAWLITKGKRPVTFYYAVADGTASVWSLTGKQSPNRCNPTNLSLPAGVPGPTNADPSWNDGCDFQVTGVGPLVTLIDNQGGADQSVSTYDTTAKANTGAIGVAWPQYTPQAIDGSVGTLGYGGGPFLIKVIDAPIFLQLLTGALTARDSANNKIDFSPFNDPYPGANGKCKYGQDNYVNIHRAAVGFDASIVKQFSNTPPRLALLDTGGVGAPVSIQIDNQTASPLTTGALEIYPAALPGGFPTTKFTAAFHTTTPHGFNVGDVVTIKDVNENKYNATGTVEWIFPAINAVAFAVEIGHKGLAFSGGGTVFKKPVADTGTISGGILDNYLDNAGLTFRGAQGCPTGGLNVLDNRICPLGSNPGQIYDTFDFEDLKNGLLNITDAGVPRYAMIWTPHWDTTANGGTGPNGPESTALGSMKSFLDNQTGLFAECAAVSSFEGVSDGGSSREGSYTPAYGGLQLQTCLITAGACDPAGTPFGTGRNFATVPSGSLPNCSDLTTTAASGCAYYGYPADPFAQVGDYEFSPLNGETLNWLPLTGTSMYKPGVLPLISAVANLQPALLSNPTNAALARPMVVADWATRNIKDNSPGKANILYLGGHDLTGSVAGTKLVLLSLLQLGSSAVLPSPTVTEVSRSTAIAALLPNGSQVLVQGTFDQVTPAPLPPFPLAVVAPGSASGWTFPAVLGHMRATLADASLIGGVKFSAGNVVFDAAAGIPPANNAGCPTPIDGTCRNVFTTTQTSPTGIVQNPPMLFFNDANAAALGLIMAPGAGAADFTTMVHRVLAGTPDGFGGYIPALGGVDRSTVAVIEPSTVAGSSARPTMAYFGAEDGMMHAVCASVTLPQCDVLGRELWAYIPRTQLAAVALNQGRIDGSPHVQDVFGTFTTPAGSKAFHTILTFQTGSGNLVNGQTPGVHAIDITDPTKPVVVWEFTAATPVAGYDLGTGLAMAGGPVQVAGITVNLAYAETNNGGTSGTGVVTTAINVENGSKYWQFSASYSPLRNVADAIVPISGIPGGAVAVDKTLQGFTTDLVFGDLFGRLWMVDPTNGNSRYFTGAGPPTILTQEPLFSFTTDFHAIGTLPAIFSDGSIQYAAFVSGGFDDPLDANWNLTATQEVVGVSLNTVNSGATPPHVNAPLNETSPAPDVRFAFSIVGDGFAQATVVGNQLFFTTDTGLQSTTDVNASGYGTLATQTGNMYSIGLGVAPGAPTLVANMQGGAGAVANVGTTLYTGSSSQQQQMGAPAIGTVGPSVDGANKPQISRKLWLRTL